MSINFPTYQELIDRIRADIASNLPEVDPTLFGSIIRAISDSLAGRAKDVVDLQEQLIKQLFPQTAEGEYLERWAGYESITRNPAEAAGGPILFTGVPSTIIPINTQVTNSDGSIYETDGALTLAEQVISISSLTRSGSVVTATTPSNHNLASNITVSVSGANGSEYNGDFEIAVTSLTEFTYSITGTPTSPDPSSSITVSYDGGVVDVTSVEAGSNLNLDSGARLSLLTPLTDVDGNQYVTFEEIDGGTDVETDEELLIRILQSRQNPVANFNSIAIEKQARTIAGVTRVQVQEVTPEIGDVTVLFVRDNDDNIIPDVSEVAEVKDAIVEIMPANTDEANVYVQAPTEVQTDYLFTGIDPNTSTMQTAIRSNLEAFYRDSVDFGESVTEDKYRGIIISTIDPDTGDELASFTLSSPTGTISVPASGLATLGDVTF